MDKPKMMNVGFSNNAEDEERNAKKIGQNVMWYKRDKWLKQHCSVERLEEVTKQLFKDKDVPCWECFWEHSIHKQVCIALNKYIVGE